MNSKDYVTYQTAKLLKAAGYPQETSLWSYLADGKMTCTYDERDCYCDAPHLWDAMKWLRDTRYINICPIYNQDLRGGWECSFENLTPTFISVDLEWDVQSFVCPTQINYEAACDSGIAAACQWLIEQQ